MMAHELLRQAALILAAEHSKGANARSIGGSIVDLHIGANRATLNPDAAAFSPYGAICKAASQLAPLIPRPRVPVEMVAQWRKVAQERRPNHGNRCETGKSRGMTP